MPEYPDVPTLRESGYDIDLSNWVGVFAPAEIPDEIRERLVDSLAAVMSDVAVVERFQQLNVEPGWMSGNEFDNFVRSQFELFGDLLTSASAD